MQYNDIEILSVQIVILVIIPVIRILDVWQTLEGKVVGSCAVLHATSQGLVILVAQVRVLASAPEIFEE